MNGKKQLTIEIIQLFAEIEGGLDGYWKDNISIDKTIIESKHCPKCQRFLEYRAFANLSSTRSFGICTNCKYAKEFWLDPPMFANFKKFICKKMAAGMPKN